MTNPKSNPNFSKKVQKHNIRPQYIVVRGKEKPQHVGLSRVNGTPRGIRTPNRLVRSQELYPVELGTHITHKEYTIH